MKRRYPISAAVIAAAAALLTACGGSGGGSTSNTVAATGGTFQMALRSDPGTVNPYQSTGGINRQIYAFAYDTLIGRSTSGQPVQQLATKWTVTPTTVTYTLRKGVTCSDGTTLTPSDVAADFNYIKAPATLSPWVKFSIPVSYTVSADDAAGTVTITSKTPFGYLLQGAGAVPIVCPAGLKNPTSIEHASDGTGPYKITGYVQGDHYTLQVRTGYSWGPDGASTSAPGTPKTVVISFVNNESTMANELVSGQLNAAQVTGPDRSRLDHASGIRRFDIPVIVGELNFNEAPGRVFQDTQVRLAAAAALNRQQLSPVSVAGLGHPADNLIAEAPAACPGNETSSTLPDYNPAKANQLLDASGWTKGPSGVRQKNGKSLTVRIIYQTGATQTAAAVELLGQQLNAVGIGTQLVGLTDAAFLQALYSTGDFDIFYSAINVDFPYMATTFFGGPTPAHGGLNSGDIINPQFNSMSAEAAATPSGQACPLWTQAHDALLSRADVIPVSVGDRPFYTSNATMQTVGLFAVPTSIRLYQ